MALKRFTSRASRGANAIVTVVLAGVLLAGCSAPSATLDSAADRADESLGGEDLELIAKLTAGTPPEDLVWSLPTNVPAGWELEEIPDEAVVQVTVSERCIIQFRQPMGFTDPKTPDSAGVVESFTQELGQAAFGTQVTIVPEKPVMFDAVINSGAMNAQFSFAVAGFTAEAEPELGGTTYAYRAGDFALIAVAVCGGSEYSKQGEEMRAFIERSRADVSY